MYYTGVSEFLPPDDLWKADFQDVRVLTSVPEITLASPNPELANHSVNLTDQQGTVIGTVTFTSVSGSSFQGTYQGAVPLTSQLRLGDTYTSTTNIGPIPISGTIGSPQPSGGGYTWSISFSGTYMQNGGMGVGSEEVHTYIDTNGNSEQETWGVPDLQTVSFSGTITGNGSNLAFSGSLTEGVQANWIGDVDSLPPGDPNHQVGPGAGPFAYGATLDTSSTWGSVSGNLM
jgi:hypothetical protein